MIKSSNIAKRTLEALNCANIEGYTLVNNYGYTFTLGDRKYDLRFWANMYGSSPNKWIAHKCSDGDTDDVDRFVFSTLDYMFNFSNIIEDDES